ncbi:MAG TPA: hypothetical protein VGS09_10645 [Actinomycetota bacterium]|jgi:hypothetical protein|nr:hypothetical protein [Actinomycetota bacterium]
MSRWGHRRAVATETPVLPAPTTTELIGRLSPAGFWLILIAFLLPFATISPACGATFPLRHTATYTGTQLVTGRNLAPLDAQLLELQGSAIRIWATVAALCAVLGACLFVMKGARQMLLSSVLGVIGAAGVLFALLNATAPGYDTGVPPLGEVGFWLISWGFLVLATTDELLLIHRARGPRAPPTEWRVVLRMLTGVVLVALLAVPIVGLITSSALLIVAVVQATAARGTGLLDWVRESNSTSLSARTGGLAHLPPILVRADLYSVLAAIGLLSLGTVALRAVFS